MKKALQLLISMMFCNYTHSQINLVPNGSFEDTIQCPTNGGQINYANNWFDPNGRSSDLFHSCSAGNYSSVPQNFFGNKTPFQGKAYAGITVYWNSQANYREYIAVKLKQKLKKDSCYNISFYMCLADSSQYLTNNIGFGFVTNTTNINQSIINPLYYYNYNGNNNNLKGNWIKFQKTITALGIEEIFIIGNFLNDNNTTYNTLSDGGKNIFYDFSYFYLDSINVSICNQYLIVPHLFPISLNIPNVFTPNNDSVNDFWNVILEEDNVYAVVLNRWGNKVFESQEKIITWNGKSLNGNICEDGTYFFIIKSKTNTYKGILTVIK